MSREGFYSSPEPVTKRVPLILIPKCGMCKLYEGCKSPKMPVSGNGDKGILIVGEFPNHVDDSMEKHFASVEGMRVRAELRELGINVDRDCWLTNALICHPKQNKVKKGEMISWCRPNLINTIKETQPKVIILLGGKAIKSLIGWLWKEEVGEEDRWAGWTIPSQKLNAWVCPTYNAFRVEQDDNKVLDKVWASHLSRAVAFTQRPYAIKSRLRADCVEIELDASKAAKVLVERFNASRRAIAFDLETSGLKPDAQESFIYSCAVSDGQRTIAYPWKGEAIKATYALLHNPKVPKIGFNIKFENLWIWAKSGKPVVNWKWCGMTAAHVLDNRPNVTSLKFQSFVLLGEPSYDDHIGPYLKSDGGGGYTRNRIKEAPLSQLLLYNGMDALLEWNVAQVQASRLGVKL